MYNAHPYFSLKNLGRKCALYMAKYSTLCPLNSDLTRWLSSLRKEVEGKAIPGTGPDSSRAQNPSLLKT